MPCDGAIGLPCPEPLCALIRIKALIAMEMPTPLFTLTQMPAVTVRNTVPPARDARAIPPVLAEIPMTIITIRGPRQ